MSPAKMRLDKWLWFARFCKSRAQAQALIEGGYVHRNNQRVEKPAAEIRPGDTLALVVGCVQRTVTVRGLSDRRGPPSEARTLYAEPSPPQRSARARRPVPHDLTPPGKIE